MEFGLFFEWPNPELRNWQTLFDESVEQIQLSEELGFDYCLLAEHHFSNYGMSPSPLLQALRIGERTKKIRIGTAALILSMWQPLRVAEEVAVLDNFLDGRFICGVGRGYHPYELGGFGIDPVETRQRFAETLDVMMKAWTSETSFTYEGQYIKVPEPISVFPKPRQRPHPPMWLAGTSADSMVIAAERDLMPMASALSGQDVLRSQLEIYFGSLQNQGKAIDELELGLDIMIYVAPTDEEARKEIAQVRWQMRALQALVRRQVTNGKVDVVPVADELDDETFEERLFFGSPETVIRKLKRYGELGATRLIAWTQIGGIQHEKIMRSVRLMGEEVIPALRDVVPPKDLGGRILEEAFSTP